MSAAGGRRPSPAAPVRASAWSCSVSRGATACGAAPRAPPRPAGRRARRKESVYRTAIGRLHSTPWCGGPARSLLPPGARSTAATRRAAPPSRTRRPAKSVRTSRKWTGRSQRAAIRTGGTRPAGSGSSSANAAPPRRRPDGRHSTAATVNRRTTIRFQIRVLFTALPPTVPRANRPSRPRPFPAASPGGSARTPPPRNGRGVRLPAVARSMDARRQPDDDRGHRRRRRRAAQPRLAKTASSAAPAAAAPPETHPAHDVRRCGAAPRPA